MALIIRCQLAVFSAYRIDQFADVDGFKTQLGAILEQYPDEVITYVCDPRTGIQRRSKFPPTISEMVEACDEHRSFLDRLRKQRPAVAERTTLTPRLRDRPQGYLANIFVPDTHARYPKLVEWAKTAEIQFWNYGKASDGRPGIWVNIGVWENSR